MEKEAEELTNVSEEEVVIENEKSLKKIANLVYLCFALSFFTFAVSAFIGIGLCYWKYFKAKGTWLESHFRWQARTFWAGFVVVIVWKLLVDHAGTLLSLVAFLLITIAIIWFIYRIIRGWIDLGEGRGVKVKSEK